ncbi:hypothetical protein P9112_006916 [Eukaryota sp. TZLM1-RC]
MLCDQHFIRSPLDTSPLSLSLRYIYVLHRTSCNLDRLLSPLSQCTMLSQPLSVFSSWNTFLRFNPSNSDDQMPCHTSSYLGSISLVMSFQYSQNLLGRPTLCCFAYVLKAHITVSPSRLFFNAFSIHYRANLVYN